MKKELKWIKVLENIRALPEGRVKTVTSGHQSICLTYFKGKFSALNNKCTHHGSPLGESSIENGLLCCPWHGWDFNPCIGQSSGGFDDGTSTIPIPSESILNRNNRLL